MNSATKATSCRISGTRDLPRSCSSSRSGRPRSTWEFSKLWAPALSLSIYIYMYVCMYIYIYVYICICIYGFREPPICLQLIWAISSQFKVVPTNYADAAAGTPSPPACRNGRRSQECSLRTRSSRSCCACGLLTLGRPLGNLMFSLFGFKRIYRNSLFQRVLSAILGLYSREVRGVQE